MEYAPSVLACLLFRSCLGSHIAHPRNHLQSSNITYSEQVVDIHQRIHIDMCTCTCFCNKNSRNSDHKLERELGLGVRCEGHKGGK